VRFPKSLERGYAVRDQWMICARTRALKIWFDESAFGNEFVSANRQSEIQLEKRAFMKLGEASSRN
jgi:hypothetical protein